MIQRSISETDWHSGQVSFPGGRCDNDETDLDASKREAFEEVGLNLSDETQYLHIGKLDKNFWIYSREGKESYIGANIFFVLSLDE